MLDKTNTLCACGHDRTLHYHGISLIDRGQEISPVRSDEECRANNCTCAKYEAVDIESGTVPANPENE